MWPSITAWVSALNSTPVLNSWSKPAIGTPCSLRLPNTVPCDTAIVGTPCTLARRLVGAKPRSSRASCSPTASDASVAPTLAATTALLMVGTQVNSARAPDGTASKRHPPEGHPAPPRHQRHLFDHLGHVDGVASAQQAEHRQRAGWLVREGALQHQH